MYNHEEKEEHHHLCNRGCGVSKDLFQSRVGLSLGNLCGSMNYHCQSIDILFSHLHVKHLTPNTAQSAWFPLDILKMGREK